VVIRLLCFERRRAVKGDRKDFPILQSACMIPTTAAAYSLNLTVVPHGLLHYLTIWPEGLNQPLVSTLNAEQGQTVANAAIVPQEVTATSVYLLRTTPILSSTSTGTLHFPASGKSRKSCTNERNHVEQHNPVHSSTQLGLSLSRHELHSHLYSTGGHKHSERLLYFPVSAVTTNSVSVDLAANIFTTGVYPFNFTIHCIGIHD